jgi:hypothetical protein
MASCRKTYTGNGPYNTIEWPIYVIGGVTFQWNHQPREGELESTVATLAGYVSNPSDEVGMPASFRNYKPIWGIVK